MNDIPPDASRPALRKCEYCGYLSHTRGARFMALANVAEDSVSTAHLALNDFEPIKCSEAVGGFRGRPNPTERYDQFEVLIR